MPITCEHTPCSTCLWSQAMTAACHRHGVHAHSASTRLEIRVQAALHVWPSYPGIDLLDLVYILC